MSPCHLVTGMTPWVGLTRLVNETPIWEDGTPFDSSEVKANHCRFLIG